MKVSFVQTFLLRFHPHLVCFYFEPNWKPLGFDIFIDREAWNHFVVTVNLRTAQNEKTLPLCAFVFLHFKKNAFLLSLTLALWMLICVIHSCEYRKISGSLCRLQCFYNSGLFYEVADSVTGRETYKTVSCWSFSGYETPHVLCVCCIFECTGWNTPCDWTALLQCAWWILQNSSMIQYVIVALTLSLVQWRSQWWWWWWQATFTSY